MRRRVLLMVLAALAAVVAVWQASRRRATALLSGDEPGATTLEGPQDALRKASYDDTAARDLADEEPEEVDGEIDHLPGDSAVLIDAQVEPQSRPPRRSYGSRFRSVRWELLDEPPEPDTTELRIGFELADEVMELTRVDVRETPSQVFVTVLARMASADGEGWFGYTKEHGATVQLNAPLGERELVHAPVDEPGTPDDDKAPEGDNPADSGGQAPEGPDL